MQVVFWSNALEYLDEQFFVKLIQRQCKREVAPSFICLTFQLMLGLSSQTDMLMRVVLQDSFDIELKKKTVSNLFLDCQLQMSSPGLRRSYYGVNHGTAGENNSFIKY